MDNFCIKLNEYKKNENYNGIIDLIKPLLTIPCDCENRLVKIESALICINNPSEYACDILMNTNDTCVVDILLKIIEYKIPRGLNSLLSTIPNLSILAHLLIHPNIRFNVAYNNYEPLRIAVLNMDIDRISLFITTRPGTIDIHASGMTTMNKSSVELAVTFDYKNIILMFINDGMECNHEKYSDDVNDYVNALKRQYALENLKTMSDLVDSALTTGVISGSKIHDLFRHSNDKLHEFASTVSAAESVITLVRCIKSGR